MPSVNLKQFSDTPQLKAWLKAGEIIELREHNIVLGRIVPEKPTKKRPDWDALIARRKSLLGDQILPGADLLIEERDSYHY